VSEYIVIATPTLMDGTVVRWYRSEAAHERGAEQVSASRNGVIVNGFLHEVPQEVMGQAGEAYQILQGRTARPGSVEPRIEAMVTHRSGWGRNLEPIVRDGASS
jgi:hypothetical protein